MMGMMGMMVMVVMMMVMMRPTTSMMRKDTALSFIQQTRRRPHQTGTVLSMMINDNVPVQRHGAAAHRRPGRIENQRNPREDAVN